MDTQRLDTLGLTSNTIEVDRHITITVWAKWINASQEKARAKAKELKAICKDKSGTEWVDLKAIDKALGTHYIELGEYGADVIPEWMKSKLNGHRLMGY